METVENFIGSQLSLTAIIPLVVTQEEPVVCEYYVRLCSGRLKLGLESLSNGGSS